MILNENFWKKDAAYLRVFSVLVMICFLEKKKNKTLNQGFCNFAIGILHTPIIKAILQRFLLLLLYQVEWALDQGIHISHVIAN